MPKLPHLHLHRIRVCGKPLPIVINARSQAAVRDHFIDKHIEIERLTPEEAFRAGVNGAVIETAGVESDTQQAPPDQTTADPGLFDQTADAKDATPASEADAPSRPIDGPGPGYVAALSEASTL